MCAKATPLHSLDGVIRSHLWPEVTSRFPQMLLGSKALASIVALHFPPWATLKVCNTRATQMHHPTAPRAYPWSFVATKSHISSYKPLHVGHTCF